MEKREAAYILIGILIFIIIILFFSLLFYKYSKQESDTINQERNITALTGLISGLSTGRQVAYWVICNDCLNEEQIKDIYLLNSGDEGIGNYNFSNVTVLENLVANISGSSIQNMSYENISLLNLTQTFVALKTYSVGINGSSANFSNYYVLSNITNGSHNITFMELVNISKYSYNISLNQTRLFELQFNVTNDTLISINNLTISKMWNNITLYAYNVSLNQTAFAIQQSNVTNQTMWLEALIKYNSTYQNYSYNVSLNYTELAIKQGNETNLTIDDYIQKLFTNSSINQTERAIKQTNATNESYALRSENASIWLEALNKYNSTYENKEPAITAGTTAQYFRGDKTFQTLNQAAVAGLTTADSPIFAGVISSEWRYSVSTGIKVTTTTGIEIDSMLMEATSGVDTSLDLNLQGKGTKAASLLIFGPSQVDYISITHDGANGILTDSFSGDSITIAEALSKLNMSYRTISNNTFNGSSKFDGATFNENAWFWKDVNIIGNLTSGGIATTMWNGSELVSIDNTFTSGNKSHRWMVVYTDKISDGTWNLSIAGIGLNISRNQTADAVGQFNVTNDTLISINNATISKMWINVTLYAQNVSLNWTRLFELQFNTTNTSIQNSLYATRENWTSTKFFPKQPADFENLTVGDNAAGDSLYDSILWFKGDTVSGFRAVVDAGNNIWGIQREYGGWKDATLSIDRATGIINYTTLKGININATLINSPNANFTNLISSRINLSVIYNLSGATSVGGINISDGIRAITLLSTGAGNRANIVAPYGLDIGTSVTAGAVIKFIGTSGYFDMASLNKRTGVGTAEWIADTSGIYPNADLQTVLGIGISTKRWSSGFIYNLTSSNITSTLIYTNGTSGLFITPKSLNINFSTKSGMWDNGSGICIQSC